MSDDQTPDPTGDEQGASPEDQQPAGGQPDPEADQGATPEGDADGAPNADDALAAAQAAVNAAQTGELDSSAEAEAAVESAQDALAEATGEAAAAVGGDDPASFAVPDFSPSAPAADTEEMQLLGDVNVDVRIELGRTRMLVEDVLKLGEGAVVELEKLAGDPVDVYVNGRRVARGEVLVLNESFCVRVNEVLEPVAIDQPQD